jgi:DNA topoisomerase I
LRAYVEGTDDPDAELEDREIRLPNVANGDAVNASDMTAAGHSTQPPARYTEASLVKAMVEHEVGRPATYASIIGTIQDRDYVFKKGMALVPTFKAFAVTNLLEKHFGELVDYEFTARMELDLDEISQGQAQSVPWLRRFYFGLEGGAAGTDAGSDVPRSSGDGGSGSGNSVSAMGLARLVTEELGNIDAAAINSIPIGVDSEGREVVVKAGRYGPYVKRGEDSASVPESLAPDELTLEKAAELLAAPKGDRVIGVDPVSGLTIYAKAGRFGPYVQLGDADAMQAVAQAAADAVIAAELAVAEAAEAAGKKKKAPKKPKKVVADKPKAASLFKTMALDTISLDEALQILSLPRVVGTDPADSVIIEASNGKFGPYLRKGTDSRSLTAEEQLLTITLEEALEVYSKPKERRGRGQGPATPPLAELGPDIVSGKAMVVKEGRFGAYVTDGETNASLRKGDDPITMTAERGSELLSDRRAKLASEPAKTIKRGGVKKAAARSRK